MAPSSRTSKRQQSKQQPTLATFNRVSKTSVVHNSTKSKSVVAKELALLNLENDRKPARPATKSTNSIKPTQKRKRDLSDSDNEDGNTIEFFSAFKRAKVQLPTPPRTPNKQRFRSISLPTEAQDLAAIFGAFCKAFALHRAHNGPSAPADMTSLLQSVTRLYQKRAVTCADLQRILGIFELPQQATEASKEINHERGPFKISVVGLGSGKRQLIDLIAQGHVSAFNERDLQVRFEKHVDEALGRYGQSMQDLPLLAFEIGTQTTIRQHKTSEKMKHIMSGRKPDLSMDDLSISDSNDLSTPKTTIKSRTLSLFDRVKAKQLANAAVDTPSADALRRKHAVARMAEVVEILRMKQQQKLRSHLGGGKVSFAVQQIVGELKASMTIPMGEDEIKLCFKILAEEVNDGWCRLFELGTTKSVVLSGLAKRGQEIVAMIRV